LAILNQVNNNCIDIDAALTFFFVSNFSAAKSIIYESKKKNSQATLFMQIDVIDQKDNGGGGDLFFSDKESFNAIQSLS